MKLIKAAVASAFSVALFAPASFAQVAPTQTGHSKEFSFEYGQNYSCSISDATNPGLAMTNQNALAATVSDITVENNGATSVTFASTSVAHPAESAFEMAVGNKTAAGEGTITYENVSNNTKFDLDVEFAKGNTPGVYGAVVTVTCAYTGGETLTAS